MQKALEERHLNVVGAQLQRIPNTTVTLEGDELEEVMNLIEKFEEDDDVQAVYHTLG
jgi:transcriptional/translational regulatory protein YebC/TACO1